MKLKNIELYQVKIPFKMRFKHSLKSRDFAENLLVRLYSENFYGIGESLPRNYVTHENIKKDIEIIKTKIIPFFKNYEFNSYMEVIDKIIDYISNHLKSNEHSAFCAFETALINLMAKEFKIGIKEILVYLNIMKIELKKPNFEVNYSAVIGTENLIKFIIKLLRVKFLGFRDVKLKIDSETEELKFKLARKILKNKNLRVDANESLDKNSYIRIINLLKKYNYLILEQPLKPNSKISKYVYSYAKNNNIKILLDEDFLSEKDISKFVFLKIADYADIRISKNGGIINSLLLYEKLKKNKIKIIFGSMVGETVLSKYNIILSKYFKTISNEGLYDNFLFSKQNLILNNEVFGKCGILKNFEIDINFNENFNKNFKKFIIFSEFLKL